jgi:hypothetical protein
LLFAGSPFSGVNLIKTSVKVPTVDFCRAVIDTSVKVPPCIKLALIITPFVSLAVKYSLPSSTANKASVIGSESLTVFGNLTEEIVIASPLLLLSENVGQPVSIKVLEAASI